MKIARCPNCDSKFDVTNIIPGKSVKCGKCKTIFKVPMLENSEPVEVIIAEKKSTTQSDEATKDTTRKYKFSGTSSSISRRYQKEAEKKAESSKWKFIVVGIFLLCLGAGGAFYFFMSPKNENKVNRESTPPARKENPLLSFQKKYEELCQKEDLKTVEGNLKVADFCKENGRMDYYEEHILKALKLKPDNTKLRDLVTEYFKPQLADFNPNDDIESVVENQTKISSQLFNAKMYELSFKIIKNLSEKINSLPPDIHFSTRAKEQLTRIEDKFWNNMFDDEAIYNEISFLLTPVEKKIYDLLKGLARDYEKKPLRTISDSEMKKRFPTVQEEIPYFSWYYTKPYLVCLENDSYNENIILTAIWPTKLNAFYNNFIKVFGEYLGIKSIENQILVMWIFSSQKRYEDAFPSMKGIAAAHYEPDSKRFFIYQRISEQEEGGITDELFFHEGTHQLLHAFAIEKSGPNTRIAPFWFNEGLATYMEAFKRKGDEYFFGVINKERKGRILQILEPTSSLEHVPFKKYSSFTHSDFWREQNDSSLDAGEKRGRMDVYYSQAWAMVYFFMDEDGKYRDAFSKFFERVLKGGGLASDFKDCFGDPDEVEKEWLEYTKSLARRE